MLELEIEGTAFFNENTNEFVDVKSHTLQLEHSLVSLSKWEQKWHKPFLSTDDKTTEEITDYIKCMTISKNVDPKIYLCLTQEHYTQVTNYINDPMTATWFREEKNPKRNKDIVTSEIIYYWMIALCIPFECKKWHLNTLMTLIRVCNEKNQPEKKLSKQELAKRNNALNEARKAKLHSKG